MTNYRATEATPDNIPDEFVPLEGEVANFWAQFGWEVARRVAAAAPSDTNGSYVGVRTDFYVKKTPGGSPRVEVCIPNVGCIRFDA